MTESIKVTVLLTVGKGNYGSMTELMSLDVADVTVVAALEAALIATRTEVLDHAGHIASVILDAACKTGDKDHILELCDDFEGIINEIWTEH
jgi:hypothetical protein